MGIIPFPWKDFEKNLKNMNDEEWKKYFMDLISNTNIIATKEVENIFFRPNRTILKIRKIHKDVKQEHENKRKKKEEEAREAFKAEMLEKYKENKIDPNYMDFFDKYYVPAFTYKALNRLIQGSAADMTKKAMVDLYDKGIVPHIQIHDELCISVKDQGTRITVQETMEKAIPLEVDNKVDYEFGPNWGNIKA